MGACFGKKKAVVRRRDVNTATRNQKLQSLCSFYSNFLIFVNKPKYLVPPPSGSCGARPRPSIPGRPRGDWGWGGMEQWVIMCNKCSAQFRGMRFRA